MTAKAHERTWRGALAAAALLAAAPAAAGLGERAEAIPADRRALAAERRAPLARPGYTVERMASPAHEVREYVSPSGVVFGVAWDGLSHPDLSRLLGAYATEFERALPGSSAVKRRRRTVRTPRLVVETWGHMRSLHGRAYAAALLPPGVSGDDVR